MARFDIHDSPALLEQAKRRIRDAAIPDENKGLLIAFERHCLLQRLGYTRRAKLLRHMLDVAREFLPIPFSRANRKDIEAAVAAVESRDGYSPWTKRDVKVALRKFFTWFVYRDEALTQCDPPELVSWIRTDVKKKDRVRVRAADLLTPEDIEAMLAASRSPRNRALVGVLYELGARIGEIGSLTVGSVSRDQYSFQIDLDGKTGQRTVRLVQHAAHLLAWLNLHPSRHDPASPLWSSAGSGRRGTFLGYAQLSKIIKDAARGAGLRKRVYPHLFRHSRVTHLLASGALNEAQAKVYFGWIPDSKVLSTYAHLAARDANNAILRMHGIAAIQREKPTALACGMCSGTNPRDGKFCFQCGYALTLDAPEAATERTAQAAGKIERFLADPRVRALLKQIMDEDAASVPAAPLRPSPQGG